MATLAKFDRHFHTFNQVDLLLENIIDSELPRVQNGRKSLRALRVCRDRWMPPGFMGAFHGGRQPFENEWNSQVRRAAVGVYRLA